MPQYLKKFLSFRIIYQYFVWIFYHLYACYTAFTLHSHLYDLFEHNWWSDTV